MSNSRPKVIIQASTPKGVQTYEYHKSELVFGRSGKADLCVDEAGISREHLSIKLENNTIFIADDGYKIAPKNIIATPRIGVAYAQEDALLPYRFYVKDNPFVSGKK